MTRAGIVIWLFALAVSCAGPTAPVEEPAEHERSERSAKSEPKPTLSEDESAARAEAAKPVNQQSIEQQRAYYRSAALAMREALATQRAVLAGMREARSHASTSAAPMLESEIAVHQQRVRSRETRLAELESLAR